MIGLSSLPAGWLSSLPPGWLPWTASESIRLISGHPTALSPTKTGHRRRWRLSALEATATLFKQKGYCYCRNINRQLHRNAKHLYEQRNHTTKYSMWVVLSDTGWRLRFVVAGTTLPFHGTIKSANWLSKAVGDTQILLCHVLTTCVVPI